MVDTRTPNNRLDRVVVDGPVDINSASAEELREVEGIGEGRAARIVEWREANGRFEAVEDLQHVLNLADGEPARLREHLRAASVRFRPRRPLRRVPGILDGTPSRRMREPVS